MRKQVAFGLILLAVVAGLAYLLPLADWIGAFGGWLTERGALGAALFVGTYAVATVLLVPGALLTLVAGLVYGLWLGVALVIPASLLGATTAAVLGRTLLRKPVERWAAKHARWQAVDQAITERGVKMIILMRLSPALPFNFLNYALGMTGIPLRWYVLGSAVGMLPGTVAYVYLGTLLTNVTELAGGAPEEGSWVRQALFIAGGIATLALVAWISRFAKRAIDQAADQSQSGDGDEVPPERDRPQAPATPEVAPMDAANRQLVSLVHPPGWESVTPAEHYNLVVIGGGTGGLVAAMGAAGLGARVALVEERFLGGDCLVTGCVPSKAMLAAGHHAWAARGAAAFGVTTDGVEVDTPAAFAHMRERRASIARHDSAERLRKAGVDVRLGRAHFSGERVITVEPGGVRLRFSHAVIATGGRPRIPDIEGLAEAEPLTSETLFDLEEAPESLLVVGGGPVGCEMAQAFARLGCRVTLAHSGPRLLPKDEADAGAHLARALEADGVTLYLGHRLAKVTSRGGWHEASLSGGVTVRAARILMAVGRAPNLDGLNLAAAGIDRTSRGLTLDDRLRTTNPRVYAVGDATGRWQFTHAADAMARMVLRSALFFGRGKAGDLNVPWCTYTDPEVARVGAGDEEAREQGLSTWTVDLAGVDRAIVEDRTGYARVHTDARGRICGATVVAERAGDLISEIVVAMNAGVKLRDLSDAIHPYPTTAEVWRMLADQANHARLTPRVRLWMERWFAWRR